MHKGDDDDNNNNDNTKSVKRRQILVKVANASFHENPFAVRGIVPGGWAGGRA